MDLQLTPLWFDDIDTTSGDKTAVLPAKVDAAIVGAGFTGLNAARVLLKEGVTVAILERHTVGWGASSRNGGLMTTGMKVPARTMARRYGLATGKAFWEASVSAVDLVEQITTEEGIDCSFSRKGHITLASKASHFVQMERDADWYRKELGYEKQPVPKEKIRDEIGSDIYHGGLVDENSASIHPAKYVTGLGKAVARLGGHLCEQTAVTGIEKVGKGYKLRTGRGSIQSKDVLITTNGYTEKLVPGLKPRIFAVGSYIVVTEPLPPDIQQDLSPKGRVFVDSKHFLNYFRLTPDGRMLFGGRNNLSTNLDLKDSARRLTRRMVEVFPQLKTSSITHSWTGRLGMTFDLMPHIGRINGIHYALGYSGHGVTIATYLGVEAGRLLAGTLSSSSFMEIAHPTHFFYRDKPHFLPLAAAYYRFLDWLT